ncbi:MAG: glycosyltransferase family 2 protein [Rhodocyclaceae bacterium]|nr:glycosyltransferase family 2 protein [Rhodocyclaceae bacterium]
MHPEFTIVIPAFREEEAIGDVVKNLLASIPKIVDSFELIVIDDGSDDRTGEVAKSAGARVISHPYNKGYGASLKTGIRAAKGRTVVFMDADGQHRSEDLPQLLGNRDRFDMVVGQRKGTAGSPLWRKPGKRILSWVVNKLAGRHVPDFNSGFRAIDRRLALRILPLMPDGFSFSTTSTIACFRGGFTVGYVPIEVQPRASGVSSVTVSDGFRTLLLIIRLVTIFAPLRVFLPVSAVTLGIGMFYIVHGYSTIGEASLRGILMVLASLHFFLFGILVDQVSALRRGEAISDVEEIGGADGK